MAYTALNKLLRPTGETDRGRVSHGLFERIHECIPRDAELCSSIQYLKELG
jgi:hypothetical protein